MGRLPSLVTVVVQAAANIGVYVVSGTIESTGNGSVIVNGIGGSGSNPYGVDVLVANGIQIISTGNITVNTDTIKLSQANDINSIGVLTIAPYTAIGTTMGVGVSSGTLDLTSTYLGYISATTSYTFGDGRYRIAHRRRHHLERAGDLHHRQLRQHQRHGHPERHRHYQLHIHRPDDLDYAAPTSPLPTTTSLSTAP